MTTLRKLYAPLSIFIFHTKLRDHDVARFTLQQPKQRSEALYRYGVVLYINYDKITSN